MTDAALKEERTRRVEAADCAWRGIYLTFDDRPVPFVAEERACVICRRARGQQHDSRCPTLRLKKANEEG